MFTKLVENEDVREIVIHNINSRKNNTNVFKSISIDSSTLYNILIGKNIYSIANGNIISIDIPIYSYLQIKLQSLVDILRMFESKSNSFNECDHGETLIYDSIESIEKSIRSFISLFINANNIYFLKYIRNIMIAEGEYVTNSNDIDNNNINNILLYKEYIIDLLMNDVHNCEYHSNVIHAFDAYIDKHGYANMIKNESSFETQFIAEMNKHIENLTIKRELIDARINALKNSLNALY